MPLRFYRRLRIHWRSVEWLYESVIEDEDGERWQRWETVFFIVKFGLPRSHGEPRYYRWRYDGRPRWTLVIGSLRLQWGFDCVDIAC